MHRTYTWSFGLTLFTGTFFLWVGVAGAATFYVSPNGKGNCSSPSSPCALNTGLSRASGGGEVVLLNGRYKGLKTQSNGGKGNPIIIRAQNRHQAIIEWPHSDGRFDQNVSIRHDNIVVRSLKVDGRGKSWDNFRVGNPPGDMATNIVVEDNLLVDGGHMGFGLFNARNVIVRHNLIENMGLDSQYGEGFYISSCCDGGNPVIDAEIYGNVIRNNESNMVDHKFDAGPVHIHHNVFENMRANEHGWGGDGMIKTVGKSVSRGSVFENNIVRNAPDANIAVRIDGNRMDILNNVFYNLGGNKFIADSMSSVIIRGNTLCNTPTSGANTTANWSINHINQPMSACSAQVQRILNEMKALPGVGAGQIPVDPGDATDPGGPVTPGPNPTPNPTPVPMNPTPCARYQSGDPAPSPYALAWNWLSSGKELLMDALCESTRTTVTIGKAGGGTGGGSTVYTWGKAYNYTGSYWDQSHPIQLTCNGTKYPTTDVTPGDKTPDFWCHGTATGVIPAATSFFVGYTCIRNGSSWQCGCTTQACTQTFWQLQGVKH